MRVALSRPTRDEEPMILAAVVVPLARIGELFALGIQVGRALGTYGVPAPAVAQIRRRLGGPSGAAPAALH